MIPNSKNIKQRKPSVFFVNGHTCRIECVGRERYKGYIDGEEIITTHSTSYIREELISDAKYREEVETEPEEMHDAIYKYVKNKGGWVLLDAIEEAIFPCDKYDDSYICLLNLQDSGRVEGENVFTGLNNSSMWRVVDE